MRKPDFRYVLVLLFDNNRAKVQLMLKTKLGYSLCCMLGPSTLSQRVKLADFLVTELSNRPPTQAAGEQEM